MESSTDNLTAENLDSFNFDLSSFSADHYMNTGPEITLPQADLLDGKDFETETSVDAASVSQDESVSSGSKKRGHDLEQSSSEHTTDDDIDFSALKAMRMGSIDRILLDARIANENYQNATSSNVAVMTPEERAELRKSIVLDYNKCFAFSDTNALAKFIRQHCTERILYVSPHNRDPAIGKADFMILMFLVIETYPDAIGHVTDFVVEDDKVRYIVDFQGTKVFPYPIEIVFKQIKAHIKKEQVGSITLFIPISSR
ncbi:hypothetical protein EON65_50785 [archaeon]|nr:MAG: hypothetical protein EON65_50785 [archaeon]